MTKQKQTYWIWLSPFSKEIFLIICRGKTTNMEMHPKISEVWSHNSRLKWKLCGELKSLLIRNAEEQGRSQEMGIRDVDPVFQKGRIAENSDSSMKYLLWTQHRNDLQANSLWISSQGNHAPGGDSHHGFMEQSHTQLSSDHTSIWTNQAINTLDPVLEKRGRQCLRGLSSHSQPWLGSVTDS